VLKWLCQLNRRVASDQSVVKKKKRELRTACKSSFSAITEFTISKSEKVATQQVGLAEGRIGRCIEGGFCSATGRRELEVKGRSACVGEKDDILSNIAGIIWFYVYFITEHNRARSPLLSTFARNVPTYFISLPSSLLDLHEIYPPENLHESTTPRTCVVN
jgi:hypothetical protein